MGMRVDDFYRMTYREVHLAIESWQELREAEAEERVVQAWLTAAWTFHVKKLKPLKEILKKPKKQPTPSREEIAEAARRKGLKVPGG
jgi:hypothetical protein